MRGILREVVLEIVAVLAVGAAGAVICRVAGFGTYWRELGIALAIAIAVGALALLTIRLLRGKNAADAAQAGLAGMTILMLGTGGLAAVATFLGGVQHREAFVWWLLAFSWTSLVILAVSAVAGVRSVAAKQAMSKQAGDDR
ncbi:MAG TPA: hypothetical protein VIL86_08185 [Tepidisphaeraceae bacterium]|jgi:heme exporter protein D